MTGYSSFLTHIKKILMFPTPLVDNYTFTQRMYEI